MRAPNAVQSALRSTCAPWRVFPFLLLLLAFCGARPLPAQNTPDIWITVFSEPSGADRVAVAYNVKLPKERLRQDMAEVARALGVPAPRLKVTEVEGIPAVEAELRGLADWRTGAVNLNPLIQAFKRYGRFRVSFFFLGDFPVQPPQSFDQPPLKVESERSGNVINYRVFIDQSHGVPASVPLVTAEQGSDWKRILGIGALALVVAVTVFLVVSIILGQRRRAPGTTGRAGNTPGSAAASGGAGEGK